jgi:hypothetical protein
MEVGQTGVIDWHQNHFLPIKENDMFKNRLLLVLSLLPSSKIVDFTDDHLPPPLTWE